MRRVLKIAAAILAAALLGTAGYVIYAFAVYYRLADNLPLSVDNNQTHQAEMGQTYRLLSYNIGFGAYSADYSFFMDGGKYARALSKEAAEENVAGALSAVVEREPDFLLLQEVDVDATRSYHLDEAALARAFLPDFAAVFAQNYDSPYLLWPLTQPHGAARAGMLTFSACGVESALRRSLPVERGVRKFLDLDRCYSVTRVPVENGKTLCLYNAHLSAYTADGSIATTQAELLLTDMAGEYAAGNYVICGGDFNKDLLGDSAAVFGVSGEAQSWAQPFPKELLPAGIALQAPLDRAAPVPSCRNADAPYQPGISFVLTVDGFLTSDNVTVASASVVDTGFAWSDHNPVELVFSLQ